MNIPLLGQVPIVMRIREGGDDGLPAACDDDSVSGIAFEQLADQLITQLELRNIYFKPTEKVSIRRR
jgi:ATP-binding protein involved in chromosome partitioning